MRKRWGKIIGIIVLLCLLVGVALFFIDEPLRLYAERQFNRHVVDIRWPLGGYVFTQSGCPSILKTPHWFRMSIPIRLSQRFPSGMPVFIGGPYSTDILSVITASIVLCCA